MLVLFGDLRMYVDEKLLQEINAWTIIQNNMVATAYTYESIEAIIMEDVCH